MPAHQESTRRSPSSVLRHPAARALGNVSLGALLRLWVLAGLMAGCGAGTPLMHPAQVLPSHRMRAGAGASQHLVFGSVQGAIEQSRELGMTEEGLSEAEQQALVIGGLANTVATADLAPWVSARAGLGGDNEMGLSYTGRRVRADLRHAFSWGDFALSIGGGVGAILPNLGESAPQSQSSASSGTVGRFDGGRISGWTVDVPVLLGVRMKPDVVSTWVGAHGLYERFDADLLADFDPTQSPTSASADGSRLFVGAVCGLSVGLRPLWIVLELSGGYQRLRAEVTSGSTTWLPRLDGFALTPSFALVADLD